MHFSIRVAMMTMGALLSATACGESSGDAATPSCGDGQLDEAEICDDGNTENGDGCSYDCWPEDGFYCDGAACSTECGDWLVAGDEECDGENYCNDDCTWSESSCGDGIVQTEFGEECDLGLVTGPGGASGLDAEGCSECKATLGFLCDSEDNVCQQTGIAPDELAYLYPTEVCTLLIGLMGGEGNTYRCTIAGTPYDITPYSVSRCSSNLSSTFNETCTIGELEDWFIGKDRCALYSTPTPCD